MTQENNDCVERPFSTSIIVGGKVASENKKNKFEHWDGIYLRTEERKEFRLSVREKFQIENLHTTHSTQKTLETFICAIRSSMAGSPYALTGDAPLTSTTR